MLHLCEQMDYRKTATQEIEKLTAEKYLLDAMRNYLEITGSDMITFIATKKCEKGPSTADYAYLVRGDMQAYLFGNEKAYGRLSMINPGEFDRLGDMPSEEEVRELFEKMSNKDCVAFVFHDTKEG